MWNSVLKLWRSASARTRPQTPRRRSARLCLEQLEDRLVPATFNAATVSDLIADIKAANLAGGSNTIVLTAPTNAPYNLTAVDNTTDGATGLPVIAAKDNLTILGNGDSIARSTVAGTPAFRLLDVSGKASLTLDNLTLQGGLAFGSGVSAEGGGIYNHGTLDLNGVAVQNNIAQGQTSVYGKPGLSAAGGGIYSSGSLTLEASTSVQNNQAIGGQGWLGVKASGAGGNGFGGGLCVSSGSVSLTDVTLSSNTAQGGPDGKVTGTHGVAGVSGDGLGGGLYVSGATVTLRSDSVDNNSARGGGGSGLRPGNGFGGGVYVAAGTVALTSDTLSSNMAQGGPSPGNGSHSALAAGSGFGGALGVAGGTVTSVSDTLSSNTAKGEYAFGGGLYVAGGTVASTGDTLNSNIAQGGGGRGGAVSVADGTLTLTSDTLSSNVAQGGPNYGSGIGGAVYVAGGTVTLISDTLTSNLAQGYIGTFNGGDGLGGALYAAGGTTTLRNDSLTGNIAQGGSGNGSGSPGAGEGGGIYIDALATLRLDAFTLANAINNTASTSNNDIFGSYSLIP